MLSEYIWRKLKFHRHRIRREIGISVEVVLSPSNFLAVSLSTQILNFTIEPF